ncbi:MAG: exodeoxyribonuclease VII small subunit [Lachnospiraceae bacterium]|nr:exodeoxyribonuclease VII small subunit [Lachnospiraceae bacterium]
MAEETTTFSLEEAFEQLDNMLEALESPEISLEKSFETYEAAMELLKKCDASIDQVEKKVLALNAEGELNEFHPDSE